MNLLKGNRMNKFIKPILIASFGIVMAAPVLAKGVLYDCQITQRDKNAGWIASQIVVIVPETGQPSVVDGIILHFEGKPIPARIKDRGKDLLVKWSLQSAQDSTGRKVSNLGYTARIAKADECYSHYRATYWFTTNVERRGEMYFARRKQSAKKPARVALNLKWIALHVT